MMSWSREHVTAVTRATNTIQYGRSNSCGAISGISWLGSMLLFFRNLQDIRTVEPQGEVALLIPVNSPEYSLWNVGNMILNYTCTVPSLSPIAK